jgi:hypothetical protein
MAEQVAGSQSGAAVSGPDYYAPRALRFPNQPLTQRRNCVVIDFEGVSMLSLTSGKVKLIPERQRDGIEKWGEGIVRKSYVERTRLLRKMCVLPNAI